MSIWHEKNDLPFLPGIYRVIYEDHCGEREALNGVHCLAYFDGVDTWSERWFWTAYEAYRAKMTPNRKYKWVELDIK